VKDAPVDLRPPLSPMTARPAPQLPDEQHGRRYAFEPKLDGWRCLAFHRISGGVMLQSRHQKALTGYFPEVAASIIEQVPTGTVLDGELVVYRDGRCDFAALQRRISGRPDLAAATSFVVFDVLALAGRDLRSLPYGRRRKRLRRLLADAVPPLMLMPATRELAGAQAWMRDHVDAGVEGVVVKHREHGYRPRRRCWWKVRTRVTADAVVGGVIGSLRAPEALVLGLPDERGRLRVAGRTGPLTLPARRELGTLLVPPQRTHPWPERIPSSRFGQLPPEPVDYTPKEPLLVVEVDADVCFEHERWRHATTYRRVRGDLEPADLT
jgi:ATP-dependent DNA ligase